MKISLGLVPGLGFTKDVFSRLEIQAEEVIYVEWIEPQARESVDAYVLRMGKALEKARYPLVLVGHSFGGMMASVLSRKHTAKAVCLISSVKSRDEIPFKFKAVAPLGIYHLFTKELTLKSLPYWGEQFGYKKGEEQELFAKMVSQQSNAYLQWALKNLSTWKHSIDPDIPYFHFHGDRDKTFPVQLIKPPFHLVKNGTHMMVFNQARELSRMINTALDSIFSPS